MLGYFNPLGSSPLIVSIIRIQCITPMLLLLHYFFKTSLNFKGDGINIDTSDAIDCDLDMELELFNYDECVIAR